MPGRRPHLSTATTVVLSRRSRDDGMTPELQAGIVAATAMMYVRILVVCSLFNISLGRILAGPLLALAAASGLLAVQRARARTRSTATSELANPLQLSTALIFALLFVVVSMLATVAQLHWGRAGVFALAGIVGVTDIDPFVLSLAQGGAGAIGLGTAAIAIILATSSNNVLKPSIDASRHRESVTVALLLGLLVVLGIVIAFVFIR